MFKFLKGVVAGSGTGVKDLPYIIGEPYSSTWGSWVHYRGTSKDDGAPVSIFSLQGSSANDGHLVAGRNGVKRLRTVRHPNILSFLHSTENETFDGTTTKVTIYIVTEPVVPLSERIKELGLKGTQRDEYFAWGLHRIAKAVSFLNNDCKLVHGNVCMASVVVTQTLDWKLHAFDVLSEFDGNNEAASGPMLQFEWLIASQYKPLELQKSEWKLIRQSPPWSIDSWGLGCFIYELFSGMKLVKVEELRNVASIPKSLQQDYQRLLSSVPSRRLNSSKLLEGEYFQNKLLETIHFMEILNLKDSVEKDTFFRKLPSLAEQLPREIVLKKLLPLLASALEFGSAAAPALTAFLKMGSWLSAEEFSSKVVPTVVKLFASNDRAIRVSLLQNVEQFGESLSSQIVDEQVYQHVATGFSDTSAFLRELTLKSMLILAPKLSQRTISGSLLKYLSKLQVDEEPAIRTNTTILLGNIASHLNEGMRKRVLINAFTARALRDPFSPARGAGIMALCATSSYYDVTEIATRILPTLVVLIIDPDSEVQLKAFQAVEQFLQLVRQSHEKTNAGETTGTAGVGSFHLPGNAGLIGWAMSSLTSKGKPGEQLHDSPAKSSAPHSSMNNAPVMDSASLTSANSSSSSIAVSQPDPEPDFPSLNYGWGEAENGIEADLDNEENGWDDVEPLEGLEDPKPSASLSNIQAAQMRPVKSSETLHRSTIAPPVPRTSTSSEALHDRPRAPQVPRASTRHITSKSSDSLALADSDPWAAIEVAIPSTTAKPLSARSRGSKQAPKLGAQRINRTSSGPGM